MLTSFLCKKKNTVAKPKEGETGLNLAESYKESRGSNRAVLPAIIVISFRDIGFSDFIHRPDIKKQTKENTTFRKLDLFPSSGEGKKPILLGPLERASLNHWTTDVINHTGYKHLRPG
jgi:hypothetical protein